MQDKEDVEAFEILIPPQEEHLALIRQLIEQIVKHKYPKVKDRIGEIQLCTSEAVANSISAHKTAGSSESIAVKIQILKDYIEVQVKDKGKGFDLKALSKPSSEICNRERGWGLELMRDSSDFLEISPSEKGTLVRMGIYSERTR